MFKVTRYSKENLQLWDAFVETCTNSHFMFQRFYMDYHSDRFQDSSLMIYENNQLIAILPAHINRTHLCSHNGLTFGGFLIPPQLKLEKMNDIFSVTIDYLIPLGITELYYKPIPHIYYQHFNESDLFILNRYGAEAIRQDALTVIPLQLPIRYSTLRKRSIKKAKQHDISIQNSTDIKLFVTMTNNLLKEKYHSSMVHSVAELSYLQKSFPDNIKLFLAYHNHSPVAGILAFISKNVVKAQYISSTKNGRNLGALDLIIDHLIQTFSSQKLFFDLGSSMNPKTHEPNYSLQRFKEMFGGCTIIQHVLKVPFK